MQAWRDMQAFVAAAGPASREEVWLLQHEPVYTLGRAGKREHLLAPSEIPLIETDRGGQITYHGPGQWLLYPLLDLRARRMGARTLVSLLEAAAIGSLGEFGIAARTRPGAPGVYVGEAKIASLGVRISRGWSYHGLSLNVDMDLRPFEGINPCGYRGLPVTQVAALLGRRPGLLEDLGHCLQQSVLLELGKFPARARPAEGSCQQGNAETF